MAVKTREIPYGDTGTSISIEEMRRLVEKGRAELKNIQLARWITRNDAPRDYRAHVNSIYNFVQQRIAFRRDPVDVEMLQDLQAILAQPFAAGDCDCHGIALATLVEAIGLPTRFVTSRGPGGDFSHVYTQVEIPEEGWITADTSKEKFALGDEVMTPYGKKVWRRNTMGNAYSQPDPHELQWPPVTWRDNSLPVHPSGLRAVTPGWPELPVRPYRIGTNNITVTGARRPIVNATEGLFPGRYGMLGAEEPTFLETLIGTVAVAGLSIYNTSQENKTTLALQKEKMKQEAAITTAAFQAQLDARRMAGASTGKFLGLPTWSWVVIGLGAVVIVGGVVLMRRKK